MATIAFRGAAMTFTKDIERLCHQVSEEKDGDRLLALVDQLNKELEGLSKVPAAENIGEQAAETAHQPEKNSNAA